MRKRRKPRVVWLPLDASLSLRTGDVRCSINQIQVAFNNTTVGNGATIEVPLVGDFQQEAPIQGGLPGTIGFGESLADLESSGYRLRRIVGKFFINTIQNSGDILLNTNAPLLFVTAGFIIRRVDEATGLSYAFGAGQAAPDDTLNVRDPWLWRRTWAVAAPGPPAAGANVATATQAGVVNAFTIAGAPPTNYAHGPSALDGPHVDAKTARIVGPEERLCLNVTTRVGINGSNTAEVILFNYDFRTLATMRTNVGNRRNSSR